ncbi:MAG: histidinol-phosphatase [Clostridia bacterium]|nr:histidinol-phosphatase [Clostridia bacterium]
MILSSYHTHSKYSDGKNTLEEMVLSAIEKGCAEIGFSDHAPMMFDCDWSAKAEEIENYKREILDLREKYKGKIKIFLGIEQDYYSVPAGGYDYIIGSVHFVYKDGEYIPVDISANEVKAYVDRLYGGDAYAYCEDYFKLVKEIYAKTGCNIIGHFDLVTKFNERLPMVDINHPRYVAAVDGALSTLLKAPAIFEVNTGAISRGYRTTPYPDDRTMGIIAKSGKPFVITSDTHNIETVTFGFDKEMERLNQKGYKYITSLEEII